MKRFLALMALVLGVVSCQTEPEGLDVNVGGEQTVTVNVTIPEAETRAGVDKSAKGVFDNGVLDGDATMRYIFQVFYKGNESEAERMVKYSDGKSVAFDVRLVPDREYTFVVWADVVTAENAGDNHYDTSDLTKIKLNDTWNAMDETRDAFTTTATRTFNGSMDLTLKLTRPFAKLRVVTTDIQSLTNLGIVPTKATVIYKTGYRDTFNAVEGKAAAATTNKKEHTNFAIASYGESNTGDAYTLFTDYFFAEAGDVVKFDFDVLDQDNKSIKANSFGTEISVKRNYLTTIKGNILTDGKGFEVKIEDAFAGELGEDNGETFANVDTAEELLEALENGTENITLDGDIDLNDLLAAGTLSTRAGATLPIVIAEGKTLELDLNGFKISAPFEDESIGKHYYAFENEGTFIVKDSKGGGQIIARGNFNYGNMTLDSGSIVACDGNGGYGVRNYEGATFVMNGGSISTSLEDDHQVDEGGYDATTLRVDTGAKATINGGTINNICDFTLAIENHGTTTIKGGTFTSVHTTIGNHSTMTIDGGSFTCNGLQGITAHALWADAGTTTINGGTFDGKDNYNGFNVDASAGAVVNIYGGKFLPVHSGSLYGEGTINVMGGEFFDDPSARVATGYKAVDNGDGTYNVVNLRASEVEIYGLTLKPDGNNSKVIVNDKEGFENLTKLFDEWTDLFTDGNGTTYTNYANGAGTDYYYAGNWTVSLEADIDLNNATISPIIIKHPVSAGSPAFTGNNHTIKNAKIVTDTATENEAGLFVSSPCGFRDLKLDNIHVTGSNVGGSTAGVLAGSNNKGIDNITITNSSVEGGKYTGGVVGYGYTDVTNCTLTNVSVKGGYKLGGLIGYICASGANTHDVTGNTLTSCSVDGIGNGIYAGGKSEYIIGMLVGNYNCNGTCQDNVVYDMTTTATKVIGKIEAGKVVNESNNTLTYVVENSEALKDAIAAGGDTIALSTGDYDATQITNIAGKTISFVGNGEDTVFDYSSQGYNSYVSGGNGNFTFENMTINRSTETFAGMAHTNSTVYKNCVINGVYFVYEKNAQFINCTFNITGNNYNCWLYGTEKVTYTNCTFNCDGKSIYVDGNGNTGSDAEFNNCTFNDINKVVTDKAAVETGTTYGKRYELIFNNTTINGFNINPNGIVTGTTLWANKHSMGQDKLNVVVDGVDVY